jgi:hypothetical protein
MGAERRPETTTAEVNSAVLMMYVLRRAPVPFLAQVTAVTDAPAARSDVDEAAFPMVPFHADTNNSAFTAKTLIGN